ncbi:hypothetical protein [Arboricoccus pini]|nr:hypothetical protein [Arboricoccus pini]
MSLEMTGVVSSSWANPRIKALISGTRSLRRAMASGQGVLRLRGEV